MYKYFSIKNFEYCLASCAPIALPRAYLINYLITPWSRVLLENPTSSQLVKKLPELYGTRRFITAFRSDRHLSLSWARSIHFLPPHTTSWRSILILYSHLRLGLPNGLIPSGLQPKHSTFTYIPLLYPIRTIYPTHLIRLDLITWKILG